MMNVASLELCEELYKLSGWGSDKSSRADGNLSWWEDFGSTQIAPKWLMPKYDLGYLLRKLPGQIELAHPNEEYEAINRWSCTYMASDFDGMNYIEADDTPENATARLCIVLFKVGILVAEVHND